ncbi:maltose ABC transporter membrane protein /trehalose ABC transporter membrane protein /sucrose ABC transporter membrane protein [Rhodovulum bhavnagarense]|uniref:Maltose ABC transporter membrane protein /trehalose ABC transporter membrane protein /sucrose ABC transporter membrane protein n=1 Tax=Rhodovulum bhavnagarense TaxID=992286 RepID=A0A4R2RCA8_9RHOB|nr:sugar ABC transporter permease [Rhodovulum bhavnagarense]TCP59749.1 maltose ABC transporter membrane protein /trehalose ABC transporter membrane protein /sucrose ABC transporter membrane protein [Rhodovulum bhavnagarense]
MPPLVMALMSILIGVTGCVGYVYFSNLVLDRVIFPASGQTCARNIGRANLVRPWLFLFPALAGSMLYLVFPFAGAFWRSLFDREGDAFIGFANYRALGADHVFQGALANSLLWVLVVPAAATCLGLIAARLTDRLRWANLARAAIFMPVTMSLVGAALIWKFVYANDADIGLLNAIRATLGAAGPLDVLQIPVWNSFFLMAVLIWTQTGFAMVILSAALRAIPREIIEAAIMDGADATQIFLRIEVPQIKGTITVVWTLVTILVLKVFDLVYAMTGGNFGTQVLPGFMMGVMFRDDGRASAVAMVLMILVLPILAWNIGQARKGGD